MTASPPYRVCDPCGTTWAGCDPCWLCGSTGVGVWSRTPVMACHPIPDAATYTLEESA